MDNKNGIAIASGLLGAVGVICKLVKCDTDEKIKFINTTTQLKNATPSDSTIRPVYLNTILKTDEPVILKLQDIKWFHVTDKIYNVHAIQHFTKQDLTIFNGKFTFLDTCKEKTYEHKKTVTQSAPLNKTNGIDISNLLPTITQKYAATTVKFKPKDLSCEDPGFFDNLFGTTITSTPNSTTISTKPKFVGTEYRRTGLPVDNSQYLIIGNFNGTQFIKDDNLMIERNKNIETVVDKLKTSSSIFGFAANSSFILSGLCLAGYIIQSRL